MGSQLLQDYREAGGGDARVPVGGGAHLHPIVRPAGALRRLLRERPPGVLPNQHHKRHYAGRDGERRTTGFQRLQPVVLGKPKSASQIKGEKKNVFSPSKTERKNE